MKAFLVVILVFCSAAAVSAQVVSQTDQKWSGYVVTGAQGPVADVKGSWIVPTGTCSGSQFTTAVFWVGIDGYATDNGTVEQAGTYVVCNGDGSTTPQYGAWYEFFPNGRVNLDTNDYPVLPNDTISAEVRYNPAAQHFIVTITDLNQNQGWRTSAVSPPHFTANRSSAECIAERPAFPSGARYPLTPFGTVPFGYDSTFVRNTCYATLDGQAGRPIGSFPPPATVFQLTLFDKTGAFLTLPSALSTDNSSFSITSCIPQAANLVAWWPADGNYDDFIGGNNGTPNGAALTPRAVHFWQRSRPYLGGETVIDSSIPATHVQEVTTGGHLGHDSTGVE